ncbi:hypothetical protein T459_00807 [Capsicum annuum]|uniref:Ubiquitin-like protease family profile domain-containing protein n=1 Tax=Capsicum annuum TaxID=4072 RepID=A0A2G3AFC0_CAPAN|nr:hypothetical protein T459_00807 [Capsicum annuum]
MFDVLFEDDLPQQPSGSLDCGVFMIMYAECLSYGHKVIATEFDPNALRTRYAALLWDYGIRKQEANAISDVEAPLRPARSSWRSFEFWRQYYFITYVLWNYSVISVWQRVDWNIICLQNNF